MPTVTPKEVPEPRSALGYDGTNFYVLKVDSDGHLQIDVLDSALPDGAASATYQVYAIGAMVNRAPVPYIYNVTMTDADTEYSQALPAQTKKFLVKCRGSYAIKVCFTAEASGTTFVTVPAGMSY